MKNRNKISLFLAFSLVFITLGCDIKARLADLPPNASIINFTILYQIDSTQNKTSIFLQMQHSKENGNWTPDDAYDIGQSIEHILKEK